MKHLHWIVALVGLLLTPGTLPASQQGEAPGPETQIKDHLDGVVRWMRGQQDRATGAYGDATTTAWVLWAMGDSPRRYVAADGFFVRGALDYLLAQQQADGSFSEGDGQELALTRLAARALFTHLDESHTTAYGKALVWLGKNGVSDPLEGLIEATREGDDALRHVRRLMTQANGNHWAKAEADRSALMTTARHTVDLARYEKRFRSSGGDEAPIVPLGPFTAADRDRVLESMHQGARFLVQVAENGKYGAPGQPDAGLTAMVIGGLQSLPEPRGEAVQKIIDEGLVWLAGLQKDDGSIHQGRLANYTTSAAVLALSKSPRAEYQAVVKKAQLFLVNLQADEGEGYSEGDKYYGGIGYGGDERPDLSNLQMALGALHASGLPEDHEAYQRAIKFLERCQNRSESNDISIVSGDVIITSGNDGGAAYYPGNSKAGNITLPDGKEVPRSYGSMTYALLKSFILAGLERDDPRVQAAFEWIQKNYTLDINPGFDTSRDPRAAYQGLFYYFLSMAKALNVMGVEEIEDAEGKQRAWKRELAGRLIALQSKESGSWVNRNSPRWWEGNPVLGTAYALTALGETLR